MRPCWRPNTDQFASGALGAVVLRPAMPASRTGGAVLANELQTTVDLAVNAHRAGRLDEAAVLYRKVLSRRKDHVDSLHYLGVIECQRGRHKEARRLIEQSLRIDRRSA